MGQVVFEGESPFRVTNLQATSASAKGKMVQLELWLADEGGSTKAVWVPLEPAQAVVLAQLLVQTAGEARGQ
jgi:hypothetical protein